MTNWVIGGLPVALLLLGFPFFLVLLATVVVVFALFSSVPPTVIHQTMFGALDKYALLAVPFFLFAGDIMARGTVSERLVRWVTSMIGGVRGNLPFTALGTATVFSAISGSTAATTAAVGSLTYSRLVNAGYSVPFASGLLIAAGAIDNLIPPSIGFILYGTAAETSTVRLFAAGVLPGLVLAGSFALYIYGRAVWRREQPGAPFRWSEFVAATRYGTWSILAPVVILGGLYLGVFSPTEAAAVACVYAIVITVLVYRALSFAEVFRIAARTMYLTAQIVSIVAVAAVYSWLLTVNGVAAVAVKSIVDMQLSPAAVLFAINILLLVVGMFLDTASAILVLTPLLLPIAKATGVDPVHFGVVLVMNLSLGTFTPPFGVNIFVGQAVFRAPLAQIYRGLVPFIAIAFCSLMLVTYVPWLSLWILKFLK